jgi:hypothetical protein
MEACRRTLEDYNMKYLLAAAVLAIAIAPAASADPDPRLGTKACVVENARAFDPYAGDVGEWVGAQKSFILNVYDCDDALRRGIDFGDSSICENGSSTSRMMAIKTSIEDYEQYWGEARSTHVLQLVPAEFRSLSLRLSTFSHPIFRLYPDLQFEYLNLSTADTGGKSMLFTMTGTCADFQ